ncbi:MAG TPA: bifunctional diaminohydroxyphosphoribosylaminopyrimidine deaminase/5-amino-6-(5-phosphoribosylamino)uracil reductase RibD [Chthoniobacterales bacterium]|nr:bifunctional diaminohydroxyphosphoribosylaminopyrimidine deaminase/5-amino-6-(5-phosphoribosylamino)uracil reductase RibD [Chthoniobacterales bacterium]
MNNDERFMGEALREARKSVGQTSPNPAVGAVLVLRNRIVARGHHRRAGLPHAEIECLRRFKRAVPKDAVLYVTLEPCSSVGRTGACTDAIIRAGVKSVVLGATDPNPRHRGRGIQILQDAGIEVRSGALAEKCAHLNEAFNKWIATGIPFVIAKCGTSLDGRLTRPAREGRWITSAAARKHSQRLRADSDAILVGAETIRIDNPHLTVRGPRNSRQPIRVVITRSGKLPRPARIFTDRHAKNTLVYRNEPLAAVLADLGKKNVVSVTIEGGGNVLGHALDEHLIDKVQIYIAPIFTGGGIPAFGGSGARSTSESARLDRVTFEKIGPDLCVTGYPKYSVMGVTE